MTIQIQSTNSIISDKTCIKNEINYHFRKKYQFEHLKTTTEHTQIKQTPQSYRKVKQSPNCTNPQTRQFPLSDSKEFSNKSRSEVPVMRYQTTLSANFEINGPRGSIILNSLRNFKT